MFILLCGFFFILVIVLRHNHCYDISNGTEHLTQPINLILNAIDHIRLLKCIDVADNINYRFQNKLYGPNNTPPGNRAMLCSQNKRSFTMKHIVQRVAECGWQNATRRDALRRRFMQHVPRRRVCAHNNSTPPPHRIQSKEEPLNSPYRLCRSG